MILNTGSRTDIPAFFTPWLLNRIREGYVLVRNPYRPDWVTRYRIDPAVVDAIVFCSKNPRPLLPYLGEFASFRTYWHMTITPYGKDIEPHVPDVPEALETFKALSHFVGADATAWRYDPVLLAGPYTLEFHICAFTKMAHTLQGYTKDCVVSFIDLYEKTKRNFPGIRTVSQEEQHILVHAFAKAARDAGMIIHLCHESASLEEPNVDTKGCFTREILEKALSIRLRPPVQKTARPGCPCLLGADIGAYNTCLHGCRYCYANYDQTIVHRNWKLHDPASPLLIGHVQKSDTIHNAEQKTWINPEITLF
ncbi:MAG: DUF1848 domain-containing protein [Acidaminococcus sp.]|jgi:hypothetical protein|nr:DUF1848 domain-containing protein [Acidaminococcus sp.]MCI2115973.1 DUF1848 domain-containing protein [Acidaminococcus sp.]